MKIYKKICSRCNELCYIWKSFKKEKICKNCWNKSFPIKQISKQSEKRKKENIEYSTLRKEFLLHYPECQICFDNCTNTATDIHHTYSGIDRNSHYLDVNTWKAVCRNCHTKIHNNFSSEELIKLGLKQML
jgi:hypothetical protein